MHAHGKINSFALRSCMCPLLNVAVLFVLLAAQPTIVATVLHEGPRQPERYSDDAFPGLSLGFSWINGATHERYA